MKKFIQLKQEFLKRWIKGLHICSSSSKKMGVLERKNAIKLSADLAMAFAKKGKTSWSRAVIAKASQNSSAANTNYSKILSQRVTMMMSMKNNNNDSNRAHSNPSPNGMNTMSFRSRKAMMMMMMNRSYRSSRKSYNKVVSSSLLAKRLVRKRTQILKRLVPGGDQCLDEVSLIKETLDYILSLRAQIDVMRCLSNAADDHHELVYNGK
ncbi:transcription factor IBH1-like 1 [Humulus lupulus]|uniref:transcription factor IBH1-like 1 n=1 Tax=Humulus lupulus TaxID=3486 RepID=UPI002B415270|nr:transcription factor IBH1-like 1 [Humulus lupulus]